MCLFNVFSEVTLDRNTGILGAQNEANDNNNDDDVDVDNKVDAGNYRGDDSDHENCKNYTVIDMC